MRATLSVLAASWLLGLFSVAVLGTTGESNALTLALSYLLGSLTASTFVVALVEWSFREE